MLSELRWQFLCFCRQSQPNWTFSFPHPSYLSAFSQPSSGTDKLYTNSSPVCLFQSWRFLPPLSVPPSWPHSSRRPWPCCWPYSAYCPGATLFPGTIPRHVATSCCTPSEFYLSAPSCWGSPCKWLICFWRWGRDQVICCIFVGRRIFCRVWDGWPCQALLCVTCRLTKNGAWGRWGTAPLIWLCFCPHSVGARIFIFHSEICSFRFRAIWSDAPHFRVLCWHYHIFFGQSSDYYGPWTIWGLYRPMVHFSIFLATEHRWRIHLHIWVKGGLLDWAIDWVKGWQFDSLWEAIGVEGGVSAFEIEGVW